MAMKRSFFDRLSGSVNVGDTFDTFDDDLPPTPPKGTPAAPSKASARREEPLQNSTEGQLPVDVHQTPNEIIIRAFVAGVRPDELSISISRDMVVIEGSRMEQGEASGPDYFTRELFWGSFSRSILLPQEVDVDS